MEPSSINKIDEVNMSKRFLSTQQVLDKTTLSRAALKKRVRAGNFPKPIRLGHRTIVWLESELDAWMDALASGGRQP